MAKEHSNYMGDKWGVIPSDAWLISLQRKASDEPGSIFHIVRLRCGTMHPEKLPVNPQTQKPAQNLYLFNPSDREIELLKEVHSKE